jgi:hypothetical protein
MVTKKEKKQEFNEENVQLLTARLGAVVANTACMYDMSVGEVMEATMRLFDLQEKTLK